MPSAVFVHTNGLGLLFHSLIQPRMSRSNSTRFGQEAEVGTKGIPQPVDPYACALTRSVVRPHSVWCRRTVPVR